MQDKFWLKRVLIPLWVIQILWLCTVLGISAADMFVTSERSNGAGNGKATYQTALNIDSIISIVFSSLSLIFDIVEIALFAKHNLQPAVFLSLSCVSGAFWFLVFILDIVAASRGRITGLSVLFSSVLAAAYLAQIIYGGVILHRQRTGKLAYRGDYAPAEQGQPLNHGYHSSPRGSYASYDPNSAHQNPFRDPSPGPAGPTAGMSKIHPAFRGNDASESLYANVPQAAATSYELQGVPYVQGTAHGEV